MEPPWTREEDFVLFRRVVVESCGIDVHLGWFYGSFTPMPPELERRTVKDVVARYHALLPEFKDALALSQKEGRVQPSWNWLERVHDPEENPVPAAEHKFSLEADLALCQLILTHNQIESPSQLPFLTQCAVDATLPVVLTQYTPIALAYHYARDLEINLKMSTLLVSPSGQTSFRWLRDKHNLSTASETAPDGLDTLQALAEELSHKQFAPTDDAHEAQQHRRKRPATGDDNSIVPSARLMGVPRVLSQHVARVFQSITINVDPTVPTQVLLFQNAGEEDRQEELRDALFELRFGGAEAALLAQAIITAAQRWKKKPPALVVHVDHDALGVCATRARESEWLQVAVVAGGYEVHVSLSGLLIARVVRTR